MNFAQDLPCEDGTASDTYDSYDSLNVLYNFEPLKTGEFLATN